MSHSKVNLHYDNMLILFLVVQNVVESIATQDGCDELKAKAQNFLELERSFKEFQKEHRNENSEENPTRTQQSMAIPQNFQQLLPPWLHSFEEFQNELYKNKGTF